MKTGLFISATYVFLMLLFVAGCGGNGGNGGNHSEHPPPETGFLDSYNNPEQGKLPVDGIYPTGQRGSYGVYSSFNVGDTPASSTSKNHTDSAVAAGMNTGAYYADSRPVWTWDKWKKPGGMIRHRLRLGSGWAEAIEKEHNGTLRAHVKGLIDNIQNNYTEYNDTVHSWFFSTEEVLSGGSDYDAKRNVLEIAYKAVKDYDRKKRPVAIASRSDDRYEFMKEFTCDMVDMVVKQNYYIKGYEPYTTGGANMRLLLWDWAKDTADTAEYANTQCSTYTDHRVAAIAILGSIYDPRSENRNEAWLRKAITYDAYVSLYAGVHGINVYDSYPERRTDKVTAQLQIDLYNEILGFIPRNGLDKVFIWGDDRDDVSVTITLGPKVINWKKRYKATGDYVEAHSTKAYFIRNIQHGDSRYILLVNNANATLKLTLSGIPSGLKMTEMLTGSSATNVVTLEPLGVRMYRISK